MGDNRIFHVKLVKAKLNNNRQTGAPWTGYNGHATGYHGHVHGAPILTILSMVPHPQNIYFFLIALSLK